MEDRYSLSTQSHFERKFHPEQFDLDQFAAVIRSLLSAPIRDLHSDRDQGTHVVTH